MSSFLPDLWASVFTPGPTATLLVATNATFGALQFLLLALLIATASVHFAILSVLCGALWFAINWFARELAEAKREEQEKSAGEAAKQRRDAEQREKALPGGGGDADDEGQDTEVDEPGRTGGSESIAELPHPPMPPQQPSLSASSAGSSFATGAQGVTIDARQRRRDDGGVSEASTDSEWEKVES